MMVIHGVRMNKKFIFIIGLLLFMGGIAISNVMSIIGMFIGIGGGIAMGLSIVIENNEQIK